jgi:hypothetical protein
MRTWDRMAVVLLAAVTMLIVDSAEGQEEKSALEQILTGALEDYVEEKAADAGISISGSDMPDKVRLRFAGGSVSDPDVFQSISPPASSGSSSSGGSASAEQACYNAVQGKIPWDANGLNRTWSPSNVKNLCKGTTNGSQPGICFKTAMHNGAAWGKSSSHVMSWSKASQLCGGTNNSSQTINCLRGQVSGGKSLNNAINQCDRDTSSVIGPERLVYIPDFKLSNAIPVVNTGTPPKPSGSNTTKPTTTRVFNAGNIATTTMLLAVNAEKQCYDAVQGKIPWDPSGKNKSWGKSNVERLCKGTSSATAPGKCFKYAMYSGSSWGKTSKHPMGWAKAIDLCEGTSNDSKTTSCFRNAIKAGRSMDSAIKQCDK